MSVCEARAQHNLAVAADRPSDSCTAGHSRGLPGMRPSACAQVPASPTVPAHWCCWRCGVLLFSYQHYLEAVLEVADEYQEVQDLLLRHATLQATNDDLRAHQQRCSKDAEDIRQALQAFVKQKTDEILDLNNTLAKLKKQLEQQEEQAGFLVSAAGVQGCAHAHGM